MAERRAEKKLHARGFRAAGAQREEVPAPGGAEADRRYKTRCGKFRPAEDFAATDDDEPGCGACLPLWRNDREREAGIERAETARRARHEALPGWTVKDVGKEVEWAEGRGRGVRYRSGILKGFSSDLRKCYVHEEWGNGPRPKYRPVDVPGDAVRVGSSEKGGLI